MIFADAVASDFLTNYWFGCCAGKQKVEDFEITETITQSTAQRASVFSRTESLKLPNSAAWANASLPTLLSSRSSPPPLDAKDWDLISDRADSIKESRLKEAKTAGGDSRSDATLLTREGSSPFWMQATTPSSVGTQSRYLMTSPSSSVADMGIGKKWRCGDWTDKFSGSLYRQCSGQGLGLDVRKFDDGSCFVNQVSHGPVQDWNDQAEADRQIRIGDRILEVNGVSDCSSTMLLRLREDLALQVLLKRRDEIPVSLQPGALGSLGKAVATHDGEGLRICNVSHNAFEAWNNQNPDCPRWQVAINDAIVEVNGFRGEPEKMLQEFMHAENLDLKVVSMQPAC